MEILGREPAFGDQGSAPLQIGRGSIKFSDVHFAYTGGDDGERPAPNPRVPWRGSLVCVAGPCTARRRDP